MRGLRSEWEAMDKYARAMLSHGHFTPYGRKCMTCFLLSFDKYHTLTMIISCVFSRNHIQIQGRYYLKGE